MSNPPTLLRTLLLHGRGPAPQARRLIRAGEVTLDGEPVLRAAHPCTDPTRVRVRGEALPPARPVALWLMHKPKGHVCGRSDPEGRPHLGVYLPAGSEDLRHIGRLDFNTTGLLLWANHPGLQRWLLAPQHHIPKTYRVKLRDLLEPDDPRLRRLSDGSLTLDGRPLQPCPVAWETHRTRATWIRIVLTEGRHRQIRRMCARVGLQIVKLERVAIASLVLPTDLTPRQIRPADADAWRALFTPWPQLADLAEPFARGALSLPAFDRVLSATDAAPEGLARAIP